MRSVESFAAGRSRPAAMRRYCAAAGSGGGDAVCHEMLFARVVVMRQLQNIPNSLANGFQPMPGQLDKFIRTVRSPQDGRSNIDPGPKLANFLQLPFAQRMAPFGHSHAGNQNHGLCGNPAPKQRFGERIGKTCQHRPQRTRANRRYQQQICPFA